MTAPRTCPDCGLPAADGPGNCGGDGCCKCYCEDCKRVRAAEAAAAEAAAAEAAAAEAEARKRRVKPVPHALDGGVWSAVEGRPSVDIRPQPVGTSDGPARILSVPMTADERSRALRAHEYAHRAFGSEPYPTDVRHDLANAVEDARVNRLLWNAGVKDLYRTGGLAEADAEQLGRRMAEAGAWQDATLVLTSTSYDGCRDALRRGWQTCADKRTRDRAERLAQQAINKLGSTPTRKQAITTARWLQSELQLEQEQEDARRAELEKVEGTPAEAEAEAADASALDLEDDAARGISYGGVSDRWGDLTVLPWALTVRHKSKLKNARNYRASERGTRIGQLRRITTDRHVFEIRRRTPGGTILIDASGSMGIQATAIARVLDAAPAATVAVYGGGGKAVRNSRGAGGLVVLARRGRTVGAAEIGPIRAAIGGLNIVDGPALDWLAGEQGPRIWISDGQVTARDERAPSPDLLRALAAVVRKKRIQRVDRLVPEAIVQALARGYRAMGEALLAETLLAAVGLKGKGL